MAPDTKPKRKTTTSSAVKARYNAKAYGKVEAFIPKELATEFKETTKLLGHSQAAIIKAAVETYLQENKAE